MLINCPRCGFSQPKDQYCASCGVNMEKYTPRKASVVEKFFSNTFVQVALVVGLTLSLSYFALTSRNDETIQASRRKQVMSTLSNSSTTNPSAASPADPNTTPPTMNETAATTAGESTVQLEAKNEDQKNQLLGESSSENAMENPKDTKKVNAITIKYSFYEVPVEVISYWMQLNGLSETPEDTVEGIVNNDILYKQLQTQPLKTETKKIGNDKESFSSGINRENSDSFIGLTSEIKLDEANENQLKGTLKLTRKNGQGSDLVNVTLNIPKQSSYFLVWKSIMKGFDPSTVARTPPFQIITSPRFADRKTELVVIVEPFF